MDEKLRILKMVEEGTMTAEQAVDLMSAMELDVSVQSVAKNTYDKKMFRVIVDSETGDKVNVQFPVGAIKKLLKELHYVILHKGTLCQMIKEKLY